MVTFFLHRLTKLLQDGHDEVIQWSEGTLHIINPTKLAKDVLPNYYGHSKFSSFLRQLNSFGFHLASKTHSNTSDYVYRNNDTTTDVNSILNLKRKKVQKTAKPNCVPSSNNTSKCFSRFSLKNERREKNVKTKINESLEHKVANINQQEKNLKASNSCAIDKTKHSQSCGELLPFPPLSDKSTMTIQKNSSGFTPSFDLNDLTVSSVKPCLISSNNFEQPLTMIHRINDDEVKRGACPLESDTDFTSVLSSLMVADFQGESSFYSEFQDVLDALVFD